MAKDKKEKYHPDSFAAGFAAGLAERLAPLCEHETHDVLHPLELCKAKEQDAIVAKLKEALRKISIAEGSQEYGEVLSGYLMNIAREALAELEKKDSK